MGGQRHDSASRQQRRTPVAALAFAAWLASGAGIGAAQAGQGYALVGAGGGVAGALGGTLGGSLGGILGGKDDGLNAYAGVIYAPAHTLSDSGWMVRGWAKTFAFSYSTDLPERPDTRIEAVGYGVQIEAGWQIAGRFGRLALFPGVAWRDYKLSPADPGSRLGSQSFGFSVTADGEWRCAERFGVMANASYVTGFGDYWAQARPFVDLGRGWKLGFDLAGYGGPDYERVRAGVFTSGYELPLKSFGRLFLGAEAGVQSDLDGEHIAPFAGANVGLLF